MSEQHPPEPHDEQPDRLEEVLGELFGGQVDPQMAQMLRQMGVSDIDPSMVPVLKQQMAAMMTPAGSDDALDPARAREVAAGIVAQQGDVEVTDATRRDVAQVVQVANLWLDAVTDLPAPTGAARAWTRSQWVEETMLVWRRLAEPVAEGVCAALERVMSQQLGQAMTSGEEIPGLPPGMNPAMFASQMGPMLRRMSSAMFGMQLGQAVGALAGEVVSGTEIGLPLVGGEQVAMVPANVATLAEGLELDPGQVHLFLAVREAARVRLFAEVPWLGPQLLEAVRAYARDIEIDTDAIERSVAEAGTDDPAALQAQLATSLFSPAPSAAQQAALERLETYLALVEGWVDVVSERAVAGHLPDVSSLAETVRRRRASGGPAEKALEELVGLRLRPRRLRDAANLWAAVEASGGSAARDAAWAHPDVAPTAADLDDPLGFVERRGAAAEADASLDAELDALLRGDEA